MIVVEWQTRHGDPIVRMNKPKMGVALVVYEKDDDCAEIYEDDGEEQNVQGRLSLVKPLIDRRIAE